MPIRLTGMNSGLDTESIITALVSNVKTKKEKYEKYAKEIDQMYADA